MPNNKVPMKYPLPRSKPWGFWKWVDIPSAYDPRVVYLRRLRIAQTPWGSMYLHLIYETDTDRHPHDHPWRFWSLILRGSYSERVWNELGGRSRTYTWRAGSLHSMRSDQAHQITDITDPLITLVLTGRRIREFCFWTEDGLVPWHRYRDVAAYDDTV